MIGTYVLLRHFTRSALNLPSRDLLFAFDCVSYMLSEGKLSYVSCIISEETLVSI